MSGISTNGLPSAVLPLTGSELFAVDTQRAAGANPQSEAVSIANIMNLNGGGPVQTLTYASTIAANAALGSQMYLLFGAGNVGSFSISNPAPGQIVNLTLKQDAVGSRTVTWVGMAWASGTPPTLTATANAVDIISFRYNSTLAKWVGTVTLNVS